MPDQRLTIAIEFVFMLVIDLAFLLGLVLLMLPLGIWRQAAFAVMKRNFAGYFSNPTGYVFLCLFVLLTSFAAFWPHEFFTTNLANFDQLNRFLPFIMLIFIPAITMSIWAEERRQGTDELLLTLPARDFDIVIGKFFAAVFIFTVSLLFSQLSNYAVLLAMTGGNLDTMLLFSTYVGYWFMGIAMLAVGMVASFFTNNLTVGFIFGAAFNAPLAFLSRADVILADNNWIRQLYDWSLLQRFEPFGRGLISPASIIYFVGLVCIGIYLSLILIGRRHWVGGRDGQSMFWHYILRGLFLIVSVIGAVLIVQYSPVNRARVDISAGQVSTLSPTTRNVLRELSEEKSENGPVASISVDAFVSGNLPTEFVQASQDLVNLLREFDVLGGNRIKVNLQQGIQPFSEEAIMAEKRFGIRPQKVISRSRGAIREEETILGFAVSSGRQRFVMPFVPYGTAVEYELIRAIESVAHPVKKRLGIIQTDAAVLGAIVQERGENGQPVNRRLPPLRIIQELSKEYEIEEVSAAVPISVYLEGENGEPGDRRFDVMLAVQPSKMSPVEMQNLITAIRLGQPVVIFEDALPNPIAFRTIDGTFGPRRIGRPTMEPADVQKLLDLLEIDIDRNKSGDRWFPLLAYSPINHYPRDRGLSIKERLVIRDESLPERFAPDHPVTRGINEIEMDYVTGIDQRPDGVLEFVPLVQVKPAGVLPSLQFLQTFNFENVDPSSYDRLDRLRTNPDRSIAVIAHIHGERRGSVVTQEEKLTEDTKRIDVIWASDVDMLMDSFVQLRDMPISGDGIEYRFQNVALIQNMVDFMAGTETWLDLRNRRQRQSTLTVVEKAVDEAMNAEFVAIQEIEKEQVQIINKLESDNNAIFMPLQKELEAMIARGQQDEEFELKRQLFEQKLRERAQPFEARMEQLNIKREEAIRQIRLEAELKILKTQSRFKLASVLIPPIPPLLMGLFVWTRRRLREREGISKARRLK